MFLTYNLHNLCNYTSLESESGSPESVVQYSVFMFNHNCIHIYTYLYLQNRLTQPYFGKKVKLSEARPLLNSLLEILLSLF